MTNSVTIKNVNDLLSQIENNPRITDEPVISLLTRYFEENSDSTWFSSQPKHLDSVMLHLATLGRTEVMFELKGKFLAPLRPMVQNIFSLSLFDRFVFTGLKIDPDLDAFERSKVFWRVVDVLDLGHVFKNSSHRESPKLVKNSLLNLVRHGANLAILDDLLALPTATKIMRDPSFLGQLLHAATTPQTLKNNPSVYIKIGNLCSALRLAEQALKIPRPQFIEIFAGRSSSEQQKIIDRCSSYKTQIEEFESIKQKKVLLDELQAVIKQKTSTPARKM